MSATKSLTHTPGPWRAVLGCGTTGFDRPITALGKGGAPIQVARAYADFDRETVDANARLIAAAPALLLALQQIEEALLVDRGDSRTRLASWARAAIALAEVSR